MLSTETKQIVTDTAMRVMEQAAFLFADEIDCVNQDLSTCVSVFFQGTECGQLDMWTVKEFSKVIAENLLGECDSTDELTLKTRYEDALKEMLNMIAGNLITDIYGIEPVFNMEIPKIVDGALRASEIPPHAALLTVEDSPVALVLTIKENK